MELEELIKENEKYVICSKLDYKGCISCTNCKVIRNHYFCGNTRLTEKQVFNSKGHCSNFKNKRQNKDKIKTK